ncbi:MAG: hypothetical protein ACOYZ6_05525 [Chloroflexota bacterium]
MNQLKHEKLFLRIIGLILVLVFLVACGAFGLTPTPHTSTAIPPTATQPTAVPPTATPTQTPSLVPGIDEPITLEERGIKFLILGVDLEAGQEAGHIKLILKYGPPFDLSDAEWIASNSQLICGATTYSPRSMGFFVGDAGRIEHFRLIFDVMEVVNLLECKLQVADGIEIPLASLSK